VTYAIVVLLVLNIFLTVILLMESKKDNFSATLKAEMAQNRKELMDNLSQSRKEINDTLDRTNSITIKQLEAMSNVNKNQLDTFSNQLISLKDATQQNLELSAKFQKEQLQEIAEQINKLNTTNSQELKQMRETIENKLTSIQKDNNEKLEQMRATVDEKLHNTLETRLGESFNKMNERLESLYKELGEVQSLSSGVNDLKKALTNIKTRGTWGEIALGNIIEDMLSPEQYAENISTKKGSKDRVEFAIKLPGHDDSNKIVYLPIDAKFPQEDYQRLLDAEEEGNKEKIDESRKQLEKRIKAEAADIYNKYLDPPNTTDFGIMFLPTESLFAEVLRIPGLLETLQREYKVTITGPTTLSAILNSLQVGFKTLAIQKRTSEVWDILRSVKTEFGKFKTILLKTQKKIQEANDTLDKATKSTEKMERKLKDVEQLPDMEVQYLEEPENIIESDELVLESIEN
jgi:DNA recombination protein RmuC